MIYCYGSAQSGTDCCAGRSPRPVPPIAARRSYRAGPRRFHDKADGPHIIAEWKTIRPEEEGEQPVEDLHPGRDAYNHGGDTERRR